MVLFATLVYADVPSDTEGSFAEYRVRGTHGGMGKASKTFQRERRLTLYLLGAICAALGALFVGMSVFGAESALIQKAVNSAGATKSSSKPRQA